MLRETLLSILAGEALPAELIVIDQSDAPEQEAMLTAAGCEIRYEWTQVHGLCRANNTGVALARHDILAFTHDDVLVEKDWFRVLMDALLMAGPMSVVTGRVLPTAPEIPGGFAPTLRIDTEPAEYTGRIGKDVLKPLNMAMYRSALARVGGFDSRLGPGTVFPGAEDADLCFRLLEAGYRILYVPEALLHHRAWRAPGDYLPLRWGYGVAQGAFFAKHLRRSDLHMLRRMLRNWIHRIRRFPFRLWREGTRGFGDPLFIAGNVVGGIRWHAQRHGSAERSRS